jgi:ubiquinone/menaquinone biosynthesis C-methylase UbiE
MAIKEGFEGDEDWVLKELPDKKTFFNGWFQDKKGKLLEAGCGVGNRVVILSKFGYDVTGIEISKERFEIAQKNIKKYHVKAKLLLGDIRKMPFADESFDIIFCDGVVEHFPDSDKGVKECYRVLKKGGKAMISVPNKITFFEINKKLQILLGKLLHKKIWSSGYERSFIKRRFEKILTNEGFKIKGYYKTEVGAGRKFPFVGKTLRVLDKPLLFFGQGGHFMLWLVEK